MMEPTFKAYQTLNPPTHFKEDVLRKIRIYEQEATTRALKRGAIGLACLGLVILGGVGSSKWSADKQTTTSELVSGYYAPYLGGEDAASLVLSY